MLGKCIRRGLRTAEESRRCATRARWQRALCSRAVAPVTMAVVQYNPADDAYAAVERLVPQFAAADIVVLPEFAHCDFPVTREQAQASAVTLATSPFLGLLKRCALQHNQHIIAGFNHCGVGGCLLNSAVHVTPEGIEHSRYDKMTLMPKEKEFFTAGEALPQIEKLFGKRVAKMVCFDWSNRAIWEHVGANNTDIVVMPANLVQTKGRLATMQRQAEKQGCMVVMANRVGETLYNHENGAPLRFGGSSTIIDANGSIVAQLSMDDEAVVTATLDVQVDRGRG